MRSRVVWVGVAIVLIAILLLVLLLRGTSSPTATVSRDAGTVATTAPASPVPTARTAPVLVDAAGTYQVPLASIESEADPEPIGKGRATLIGRVLGEDGNPIAAFGIMISRGGLGYIRIPGRVETTDGRFVVGTVQAGTWSVFFAVPGLARKWITGVRLVDDETTDLGDVVIDAGLTIRGRVLDGASRPIAGAKVSTSGGGMLITQIGTTKMSDEYRAMRGVYETTSDASGAFVLTGLTPGLSLSASHQSRSSQSVDVGDDDATIDLVIGPTGKIIGTAASERGTVHARMRGGRLAWGRIKDKRFEIEKLWPGIYDVWLSSHRETIHVSRTVEVGLNATVSVTFQEPARVVAVEVTGCKLARMAPVGIKGFEHMALEPCRDGKVTFPSVEPGTYALCTSRDSCIDIVVSDTRARQSFAAPAP